MKALCFSLYILLAFSPALLADDEEVSSEPVRMKAHFESPDISIGGHEKLIIELTVAPGLHAYRDVLELKWIGEAGFRVSEIKVSPTRAFEDPFSNQTREVFENHAKMTAIVTFPNTIKPGNHEGRVSVKYQACSKKYCLFPKTVILSVPFVAANGTS